MATGYEPNLEGAVAVLVDLMTANEFTMTRDFLVAILYLKSIHQAGLNEPLILSIYPTITTV